MAKSSQGVTSGDTERFRVFEHEQRRYLPWRRFCRAILLRALAFHILVTVESHGMERIPASGPTLLMMNHIGGIDPIVLLGAVGPRYLASMSKIENFAVPGLGLLMRLWGAYPITRGDIDRRALDFTLKLLREGELVLIAPEGTRQPQMSEAKDGLAYLAVKSNAVIVPVGLEGTREFATNLKHLRRTHITLNFGRPFRFRTDGRERVPRPELAAMTREAMYQLAELVRPDRRGFYHDLMAATTDRIEFV